MARRPKGPIHIQVNTLQAVHDAIDTLGEMLVATGVDPAAVAQAKADAAVLNSDKPLKDLFFEKSPIGQFFSKN